ncbi:Sec-independent protein translocase TatCD [Alkalihalobacillus alcalophilus ATCC 27647 = CGMCC 1.3604]|uniref:Sec-independent protein translocase protein TatC n=1 Tax=Alkalihalobacillus alcalophilus ATCC 27647 = CGMCC 1.3604 TaxID=1218173 RepID=J8Q794_ALKAL|nr:twin-arginine translocase subunit TatC [Alkalihalobacillus alcalophilus]AFV25857.1 protein export transporter [Alkalihalobacillus alcalophilus ATCC 27647 = CGMCC 1.3604]KGA96385.1 preprotein translocase subunit TatC [Alkalihalobacillus alcalophilus ATCC 27647 = CGMCC 1.3604]MED1563211.1 twin-arginine translocase subunit TatC [Alkalihalobacillus alcalophilus]THG90008.1 Sec-independent protein translocase TatCD [Alkalihalobacillus alcalophilus ATCC 27647 = CGMCC 1.3604]
MRGEQAGAQQSIVEHLTDLRKAVLYSAIFFVLCFIGILLYINKVIPFITNDHKLVMLGPLDVIRFYTGIAGSLSLGLSAPFIGYQIWKFAKPALTEQESKTALTFIPSLFISFILGLSFGVLVIFPTVYSFLMGLGVKNFEIMITAKEYFSFLMMTTIPLGFLFEVPLLMMFLTAIGVVTPDKLKEVRKYGYVLMAVVSALITPPDFISQLIVLVPLMLLYEIGVILSKVMYKKRLRAMGNEKALVVE